MLRKSVNAKKHTAYIALGSNLDNPAEQLKTAIEKLRQVEFTNIERVSSFYQNAPVGNLDQPDFVNAIVKISTEQSAHAILMTLQMIEAQQGRVRSTVNAPRTIDLDLLLFDDEILQDTDLIIPHPRMKERSFVIVPLYEIEPTLCLPCGTVIADLLEIASQHPLEKI